MKEEEKVLSFSIFINIMVALIKIMAGKVFGIMSIIADGFYTISDFITDILALIGAKVGRKRPNKRHPLGYGNFEFIMELIMGFLIFMVGIIVIAMGLMGKEQEIKLIAIVPILGAILLKLLLAKILIDKGKQCNSSLLIESSKEAFIDSLSSSVLILVIFLSKVYAKADLLGSLFIGIIIFYQAYKIIRKNIVLLIGESTKNQEIELVLEDIFKKYKKIDLKDYELIKHGSYYEVVLNLKLKTDYTINSLLKAERNIKRDIKKKKIGISYVDFEII